MSIRFPWFANLRFGLDGTRPGDQQCWNCWWPRRSPAAHRQRTAETMNSKVSNLEHALASNRDIGVAMGILSARHSIRPEQTFALLRVASPHTNRKFRDLAAKVIETGQLLDNDRSLHRASSSLQCSS